MRWVRYAGKIQAEGDSVVIGHTSLEGGWRPGLASRLAALGIGSSYAGIYSDAYGSHSAVSGSAAVHQGTTFADRCETLRAGVIVLAWGVNDMGGAPDGQGRTAAQTITTVTQCVRWARARAPWAIVVVQSVIVPQTTDFAAYWAARAEHQAYNAAMPAVCAVEGARWLDVGAPECPDGVHPSAAGFGVMADAYAGLFAELFPG